MLKIRNKYMQRGRNPSASYIMLFYFERKKKDHKLMKRSSIELFIIQSIIIIYEGMEIGILSQMRSGVELVLRSKCCACTNEKKKKKKE